MRNPKRRTGLKTGLRVSEDSVYNGILGSYLSSSNHPDANRLLGHLRARDYGRLIGWTELLKSPQMYDSASLYFEDAQLSALIKKYPFTEAEISGINPEEIAVRKFRASEHRCKRVNQKWRAKRTRFCPNAQFWADARSYILRVLGESPDIMEIMRKCDFTAGASKGVHGNATNLARKFYAESWSVTPTALPYAMTALWYNHHARDCILPGTVKCFGSDEFRAEDADEFRRRVRHKVEYTSCNNIAFVPKTAKSHRSIAVEPLLNGFVQKGIDVTMRGLLRTVNIDLSDQTPNQVLAFAGSLGGSNPFCTIDLASASDTLSYEVVRELVPADWFELLCAVRSPAYTLHGQDYSYEKFCSMGNGFCFPLQTLIFASVCHAAERQVGTRRGDFAVYGDDIVVPQTHALLVIERLRDLGFSINRDKTFVTGLFRESCGRDWFQGQDVRPVNLDTRMSDIRQVCAFHNSTLRSPWTTLAFTEVRSQLRDYQPSLLRPGVEPGDTCFSVPLDLAMTSPKVRWSIDEQRWSWEEIHSRSVSDNVPMTVEERANVLSYAVLRGANPSDAFTLRYTTVPHRVTVGRQYWSLNRDVFGVGSGVRLNPVICRNRKAPRPIYSAGFVYLPSPTCKRQLL